MVDGVIEHQGEAEVTAYGQSYGTSSGGGGVDIVARYPIEIPEVEFANDISGPFSTKGEIAFFLKKAQLGTDCNKDVFGDSNKQIRLRTRRGHLPLSLKGNVTLHVASELSDRK